MSSGSTPTQTI